MTKPLRITIFSIVTLIALLAIAAGIFVATFDPNRYRPTAIEYVKQHYGRTLSIDGSIGLSIFPRIALTLPRTSLSATDGKTPFASIESARATLALWPLLTGRAVVDRVALSGASVELARHRDGSLNIDDLLGKRPATGGTPTGKPAPQSSPAAIEIAGIALDRARIAWRDEQQGTAITLADLKLETGPIAARADGKWSLDGNIESVSPKLTAKIHAASRYRIDVERGAYGVSGLDATVAGDLPGLPGAHIAAQGDAEIGGRTIHVAGLRIEASARDGLKARVDVPKLDVTDRALTSSALTVDLKQLGAGSPQAVDAKITIAPLEGSAQGAQSASVAATFDVKRGNDAIQGKIASPLQIDREHTTAALAKLNGEITVAGPTIPHRSMIVTMDGRLSANWSKSTGEVDLVTRFDETNAKLRASVTRSSPLDVTFNIDADRLNVDRYRSTTKAPASAPVPSSASSSGSTVATPPQADKPIDLSVLNALDANGAISVGSLTAAGLKLEAFRAHVKLARGHLDLSPLSANLYQGSMKGAIGIDAAAHRFTMREQLANVAIGPLLRDLADKDLLEGRGTLTLDVTTTGQSMAAIKRGLTGAGAFNLRDAAVKGINLADLYRKGQALAGGRGVQDIAATKTEKTDFSELVGTFTMQNGVAHNADLVGRSPFLRLTGAGDVDIGEGRVNYTATVQTIGSATGQGGRDQDPRRGVTIPVQVAGTFDDLHYKVDFQGMAVEAVKGEARRRLDEEIRKRLGDDPRGKAASDLLKGLLGK